MFCFWWRDHTFPYGYTLIKACIMNYNTETHYLQCGIRDLIYNSSQHSLSTRQPSYDNGAFSNYLLQGIKDAYGIIKCNGPCTMKAYFNLFQMST